jgi:hypothetical protein
LCSDLGLYAFDAPESMSQKEFEITQHLFASRNSVDIEDHSMDVAFTDQQLVQLVTDAYQGTLGRSADEQAVTSFIATVRDKGGFEEAFSRLSEMLIQRIQDNENTTSHLSSLEHWNNTLHLTAPYVLRSLYLGILDREPEGTVLNQAEQRLKESDLESLIRSFESSTENYLSWQAKFAPQMIQKEINLSPAQEKSAALSEILRSDVSKLESDVSRYQQYHDANNGIEFHYSNNPRLNISDSLALIFVPNESWLPYALAIAQYFNSNYKYRSVLTYLEWSPAIAQATSLESSIHEVIHISELRSMDANSQFYPKIICTHSFGWLDDTRYLLTRFPETSFYVFADGLKNGVDAMLSSLRRIDGSIFFSYALPIPEIKHEITIPIDTLFKYVYIISNIYHVAPDPVLLANEVSDYAVIYLRYWGGGIAYPIDLNDAVQSIVETSVKYLSIQDTLVIKNDPRAKPELFSMVQDALAAKGFNVVSFADYLSRYGVRSAYQNLPAEYFFSKGLLCRAKAHVVLDSSLGYIVATSPHINRQTDIIVGADMNVLERKFSDAAVDVYTAQEKNSVSMAIGTIRRYSNQYCEAILNSEVCGRLQLLDNYNNNLFHIRLI